MATSLSTVLIKVRQQIKDTSISEYQDSELINYVNDALSFLNTYLISIKDPEMVVDISVNDGDTLPLDYYSLVGNFPLWISNGKFHLYTPGISVSIRYFNIQATLTDTSQIMPFRDVYIPAIVRITSIYALNRNEYDLTQDTSILSQILSLIKEAKDA